MNLVEVENGVPSNLVVGDELLRTTGDEGRLLRMRLIPVNTLPASD